MIDGGPNMFSPWAGSYSRLLSSVQDMTINLGRLAGAGSPLADSGGYDLWRRLSEAGKGAMRMRASVPMAMVPILRRREVFEVYTSLSGALESYLFDSLFSRYSRSIDEARFKLTTDASVYVNDEDGGATGMIMSFCLSTTKGRSPDFFLKRYGKLYADPRIVFTYRELCAMRDELRDCFRRQLNRFRAFQDGLSSLLGMIFAVDRRADAEMRGAWSNAYSTAADLMRDADNVLTSMDIAFTHLAPPDGWGEYERRMNGIGGVQHELEKDLHMLTSFARSDIASIADLAVYVNMIRARSGGVKLSIGEMSPIRVPEPLRADLFRVMNGLLIDALRSADLEKKDRRVRIEGERRDALLRIFVSDNGRGVSEEDRMLNASGLWGLARARRVANRRGWEVSVESREGEGAKSVISIDMSGWPGVQPSPAGEGADAEGLASEAEIASSAHLASQSSGVMALTGASFCFARMA